ncbi:MAG: hypothetical protein RDA78_07400 [Roseibium sp.]|uniref:hypothetical protein n=1 Tax=Roseibium sp. TaxID=1936156 RepID=UPI003D9C29FA
MHFFQVLEKRIGFVDLAPYMAENERNYQWAAISVQPCTLRRAKLLIDLFKYRSKEAGQGDGLMNEAAMV